MPVVAKKATFSLREDILKAMKEALSQGAAPSRDAFVERAILRELREWRRTRRRIRWDEAARDPLFLEDLDDIEAAFRSADAETARRLG